ncbi:MAG: hypothetical protein C0613_10110 [Desulfobulbaceae bacterium]|nr:MAG: hypothetical protein C0613_10110 [Desulfobulbaceae bacterium]
MELIIGLICFFVIYRIIKSLSSSNESSEVPEFKVNFEVSSATGIYSDQKPYEQPNGKPAKWYGPGQSVKVQSYNIPGGLIYVGETLLDTYGYENDSCLINPKLKISAAEPWENGGEMGYWPQYADIPAKCRGAYLKWLTDGRSEPEANIGYVFLFFYGLERRLFIDGQTGRVSESERSSIVIEVNRLLKIYGGNRSFQGYAKNFLAMEWVLYRNDKPVPDYLDFSDRYCSEPFQVVLAQHVVAGNPIPADVALQWVLLHPEFGLRTPARRCAKEFRELFVSRYKLRFGEGLLIKPNKTRLKIEYRSANSSIRVDLNNKIPDLPNPFILKGPFKKLGALVEECTDDLDPYSRYLGRKQNDPNSLAALALLPKELMSLSPAAAKIKAHLSQVCQTGPGMMSINILYEILGEKVPLKINKKEAESLAALVEGMGFGLSPDVRYHHIKPKPDGKVVIFPKGHGVDFLPSKEFRLVAIIVRLGAIVSQIDQDLSPAEEATLQAMIHDNRELNTIEKESLLAFLYWCLRTPQGVAGIKQKLSDVSTVEKTAISHILISIAHADGRIDPKEVKQLEKLYTTLGLDKEQVTSDLHVLASSSEPVTVGLRDPDPGFSIPTPTPETKILSGFSLNQELIRIREEETRQVQGVLEGIFSDEEEDVNVTPEVAAPTTNPLMTLDKAHQDFFHHLQKQETWERTKLNEVCKELGLMLDGAMEELNEWAYEHVNAPLIDDGEPVYVDVSLAKEITYV